MFNKAKKIEREKFDRTVDKLLTELLTYTPHDHEYQPLIDKLEQIDILRNRDRFSKKVSADTVVLVIGNLIGIAIIVGYESRHVVTSIATKFLIKPH